MNDAEYNEAHPPNEGNKVNNETKINNSNTIEVNEVLEYLFTFFNNENNPKNYVLAGYFSSIVSFLFEKNSTKLLKYLYIKKVDVVEKIIEYSYMNAFSQLAEKFLNFCHVPDPNSKEVTEEDAIFEEMIKKRDELIGKMFKSAFTDYQKNEFIVETLSHLIRDNAQITKYCIESKIPLNLIFQVLSLELKEDFNGIYTLYSVLLQLMCELFRSIIKYHFQLPYSSKDKVEPLYGSIVNKSLKYIIMNFKERNDIINTASFFNIKCIGKVNMNIMDYVIELFKIEAEMQDEFDTMLIENNFIKNATNFFLTNQFNDMYKNKYIDFLKLYLNEENINRKVSLYLFRDLKLHEIVLDLSSKVPTFYYNSGKSIHDPIYPFLIAIGYKVINVMSKEKKEIMKNRRGSFVFFRPGEERNEYKEEEHSQTLLGKIGSFFKGKSNKAAAYIDDKWKVGFYEKIAPIIQLYESIDEVSEEIFIPKNPEKEEKKEEEKKEEVKEEEKKEEIKEKEENNK